MYTPIYIYIHTHTNMLIFRLKYFEMYEYNVVYTMTA